MSEDNPSVQCRLIRKVQIDENPLVIHCSENEKSNTSDSSSKDSCTFEGTEEQTLNSLQNRSFSDAKNAPEYLTSYCDDQYETQPNEKNTSRVNNNSDNFLSLIYEDREKYEDESNMSQNYKNLYNKFSSKPNSKTDLIEDSVLNNSFITNSQRILENFQKWTNKEPLQDGPPQVNLDVNPSNTSSTDESENDRPETYCNKNYNSVSPNSYHPSAEKKSQGEDSDSESGSENYLLLPRDYSFGNAINNINNKPTNWQQQYISSGNYDNIKYRNEYEFDNRGKPIEDNYMENYNTSPEVYPKEEIITSSVTTEYYQIPQQQVSNIYKTALQTNLNNPNDERTALMNLITEYLEDQKREGSLVSSSSTSSSNDSTIVDMSLRRFSTLDHDMLHGNKRQTSSYQEETDNITPITGELEAIVEVPKDEIYSTRYSNYSGENKLSPLERLKLQEKERCSDSSSSVKSKEDEEKEGHKFIKTDEVEVPKDPENNPNNNTSSPTDTQNSKIVSKGSSVVSVELIPENKIKSSLISAGVQNFLDNLKEEKSVQDIDFGNQPLMPELKTSCSDEHCENKQHSQETCASIPLVCAGIQSGQICSRSEGYANVLTLFTFVILGGISLVSLKEIYCTCHPSFFLPVTFLSFAIYSAFNAIEAFECITCKMTEFTPHRTAYMVVMTLAVPFLAADAWTRYMKHCYSQVAYAFPCLCLVPFWFSQNPYEIENALFFINGVSFATFTMLCCIFQSFIGTAAVIVFVGSFAVVGDLGSTKDPQMQSFLNFCHCIFLLFIAMSLSTKRR